MGKNHLKVRAAKTITLLVVLLSFVGCNRDTSESPTSAAKPTYKYSTIAEAEKAGVVPVLDRSHTLAGIDADNNGIRDDVERYIDSLQLPPEQTSALRFLAYGYQEAILVNTNDEAKVNAVQQRISKALTCLHSKVESRTADKYFHFIRAFSLNTRWRSEAYIKYNRALNGGVYSLPTIGDFCEKH